MYCLGKGRNTLLVHSSSQQLTADGLESVLIMYGRLTKFAAGRDRHGSVMPSHLNAFAVLIVLACVFRMSESLFSADCFQ